MAEERLGASFSIDVTNLKAGLSQANKLIRESESEFKAAAAGLDDWTASEEGLNAKIKQLSQTTDIQKKKVNALQSEYDRLISEGLNPASDAAVKLRTQINNEQAALNKNQKELDKTVTALEELGNAADDAGDKTKELGESAEKSSKGLENLKSVGGAVVKSIAGIAAACVGAVTAFFSLAESTRETRTMMAKLDTQFTTAGHSAEQAAKTYSTLYGVLGDTGKASEASAFLAQLGDNEQELTQWTDALTGVYATFGDSLPVEGLAEAALHTSELGSVQGNLADALEWSGVNVDDFNAQLAACNSTEERQALIVDTLNGLYGEQAEAYKEANKDVIEAQEAQEKLNLVLAELGAIAEPIMTMLKLLAVDVLNAIKPFVELIGNGLKGAMEGTAGSAEMLAEGISGIINVLLEKATDMLPTVLSIIVQLIPAIVNTILSALPTLLDIVLDLVTEIINVLTETLPQIIQKVAEILPLLIQAIIDALPEILQAILSLINAIVDALPTVITTLVNALPPLIEAIVNFVIEAIPVIIDAAIQLFMAIIDALPVIIEAIVQNLPRIINTIIDGLLVALPLLLEAAITLLMAIIDALPTIINLLIKELPKIITTIINTLLSRLPDIINGAIQLFEGILDAIPVIIKELVKKMPEIITTIVSSLGDGFSDVVKVGENLIKGLWEGISNMVGWIGKKIKGFGEDVLGGIKDFFGIESPSKVMANVVGKNLALGIGKGFEDNIGNVNDEITDAMNLDFSNNPNKSGGAGRVVVYQTNNYSQAHSRLELYKSKQATAAAVRLALEGV